MPFARLAAAAAALALLIATPVAFAANPVESAGALDLTAPALAATPAELRMREHIRAFEAGERGTAHMQRLMRDTDGQPFYLVTPLCCDQFNPLYDAHGRFVCAPSGGFAGNGDGRCPAWVRGLRLSFEPLPTARNAPATARVY